MRRFSSVLSVFVTLLASGAALAACDDPPGPDVFWGRCIFDTANLQGLNLSGATLHDASFVRADLRSTVLIRADGLRVRFVSAMMEGARMDDARFEAADFTTARMKGASLRRADLRGARFYRADLRDADLTGARITRTDLFGADLSGARWIDGARICAPGSIGQCNVN